MKYEVTNDGKGLVVDFYYHAKDAGALEITKAAYDEIKANGHSNGYDDDQVKDDTNTLVAKVDGEIAGVLCFGRIPDHPVVWVMIAHVRPSMRGRGIHTALFEALKIECRKDGIKQIDCGTHIDNEAARAAFHRQGRKPYGLYYRYELTE